MSLSIDVLVHNSQRRDDLDLVESRSKHNDASPQCQLPLSPVAGWLHDPAQGTLVAPITAAPAVQASLALTVRGPPLPLPTLTQILSKKFV